MRRKQLKKLADKKRTNLLADLEHQDWLGDEKRREKKLKGPSPEATKLLQDKKHKPSN